MTIIEKYRTWLVENNVVPHVFMGLPMGGVRRYGDHNLHHLNRYLGGETRYGDYTNPIQQISNAIKRHILDRDVTVYTGLPSSPEKHRDPKSRVLKLKNEAFTSTSILPSDAMRTAELQSDNTNVNKLRQHIENGDHEKAEELLKNHHIYFRQHSRHQSGLVPHDHGEKFDLNNQSHIDTLNSSAHSGGEWQEANHVIKITLPEGSHALSHDKDEVLLHHGAQMDVHKTEVVSNPDHPDHPNGPLTVVHHAILTHDGVKPTGLKPPRRK